MLPMGISAPSTVPRDMASLISGEGISTGTAPSFRSASSFGAPVVRTFIPDNSFRLVNFGLVAIWYGGRTMVKSSRTPLGANSRWSSTPPGFAICQ